MWIIDSMTEIRLMLTHARNELAASRHAAMRDAGAQGVPGRPQGPSCP